MTGSGHVCAEEFPGPVAVIAGGLSHERDVSLASGRNLVRELGALGVEVHAYDFDRNLLHTLERDKVVAVLPALHGQFGEDGEIQTLLELIGMPYVGSRSPRAGSPTTRPAPASCCVATASRSPTRSGCRPRPSATSAPPP